MSAAAPETLTVRARPRIYVVITLLMAALIVFVVTVAFVRGTEAGVWRMASVFVFIWLACLYYLTSVRLVLQDRRLVYRRLWSGQVIDAAAIASIEWGFTKKHLGPTARIGLAGDKDPILLNTSIFRRDDLDVLFAALRERAPHITFRDATIER